MLPFKKRETKGFIYFACNFDVTLLFTWFYVGESQIFFLFGGGAGLRAEGE